MGICRPYTSENLLLEHMLRIVSPSTIRDVCKDIDYRTFCGVCVWGVGKKMEMGVGYLCRITNHPKLSSIKQQCLIMLVDSVDQQSGKGTMGRVSPSSSF